MVEWEIVTIGDLLEFKNGLNKGKEFFGMGTPIVNYMDVYKNRGIHAKLLRGRVMLSADEIKRYNVHKGDVLFTRTSETPEEIGFASVMLDEVADCVFSGFVLRGRPKTDKLDINYCQYVFMTEHIRKSIISGCTYTTRALTNGKQLSAIEIRLPDKLEQRCIAEVLSDTDTLITALEKLIAKKRNIKQGMMQELLTGKRQLSGFDGEWVEKRLEEVAPINMGQSPDSKFYNTSAKGLPLIQGNADIEGRKTIIRFYTSHTTKFANKGDIILTVRAPVGNVAKADFDCCLGRGVCAIKASDFLYHYLVYIEQSWGSLSKGSTFDSINRAC